MINYRNNIINILKNNFINDPNVCAIWLEGADALKSVDEFSDIDVWVDVNDGFEEEFISNFIKCLSSLSEIDYFYEKKHPHPKIRQMFIHLSNSSDFLIIDLCVQSHSREIDFVIGNKDEDVKVLFDKVNVIKYVKLDINILNEQIAQRIEELNITFKFFSVMVFKEIKRKNFLEALNYYHENILRPLVELCRIKVEPTKRGYHLKQIRRDLPSEIVNKLEYFYKVNSLKEIETKTKDAIDYYNEIMSL